MRDLFAVLTDQERKALAVELHIAKWTAVSMQRQDLASELDALWDDLQPVVKSRPDPPAALFVAADLA